MYQINEQTERADIMRLFFVSSVENNSHLIKVAYKPHVN